ncbi:MAG TPA: hypothetical protein PKK23_18235 [Nitrospirales bacterium]|nr:hypothetical protein [Nitrospirales bacterium]
MPLSIEDIGPTIDRHRQIAHAHMVVQNGDLMVDPEMVLKILDHGGITLVEPLSFRNDYMGVYQAVYRYNAQGKATHVDNSLKAEPKTFARMWFRKLKHQGFLSATVTRVRLS